MLVFIEITIFVLMFTAISVVIFQTTPLVQKGVVHWQNSRIARLSSVLEKMFIFEVSRKKLLMYNIVAIALGAFFGSIFIGKAWAIFAGGFIGSLLPPFIANKLEQARSAKLSTQIVDMLMLISGSLRAGLNLLQSLETVVEEMPNPISQEIGLLVREIHVGVSLEEAFNHLRDRVGLPEFDLITTAIFIARETGGDLTKTFSQLVYGMRERTKLSGKVKALTIQGKLQGLIMSAIPIVFVAMIHQMNKHHFDIMLQDRTGQMLLGTAILLQVVGMFLINKLSKVNI